MANGRAGKAARKRTSARGGRLLRDDDDATRGDDTPRSTEREEGDEGAYATRRAPHEGVAAEDVDDDVLTALERIGASGATVTLWRENERRSWDYVTTMNAAEFNEHGLPWIRDEFGGGRYKLVATDPSLGNLNPAFFSIDQRFRGRANGVTTTPAASSGESFAERMLLAVMPAMLAQRNAPPPPVAPAASPLDLMRGVAEVAKLLRNDGAHAPSSGMSADTVQTMLGVFEKGLELGATTGGDGGDGFSRMLPALTNLVTQLTNARGGGGVPRANALPATPPAADAHVSTGNGHAPPSPVVPSDNEVFSVSSPAIPSWLRPVVPFASYLLGMADTNADPAPYADVALNELQNRPQDFAYVVDVLNRDGAAGLAVEFTAHFPAFNKTPARVRFVTGFTEALAEGVRDMVSEDAGGLSGDEVAHGEA